MDFDLLLLKGFYALMTLFTLVFFFQRIRYKRRKRLGKRDLGFYPTTASIGSAFLNLQLVAEPQRQYQIQEDQDNESDEDDSAGPDDPIAHLHKQARKIRRGEKLGRFTTFIPKR